ncbi:MAG: TIGR03643 family protein [Bacteroidota bacterium]
MSKNTPLPTDPVNSDELSTEDIDRVVEMAWEDRTPFEAIEMQFGLSEAEVIKLMRREMKASSWRMWRARVQGRATKHRQRRDVSVDRFRCSRQRPISRNKISKR